MEGSNPEDKFGVDHVETPDEVMGVDVGNGITTSAVRHAEENPDKPRSAKGKNGEQKSAGSMLASGEKDQPSDKDESSEGWSNRTGSKAKLATSAATSNVAGMAKEVKKNGGLKATAKKIGPIGTIMIALLAGMGAFLGNQSMLLPMLTENLFLNYDYQNIITNIRSKIIFKMQMKSSIASNSKWADFTRHQKKKLANAGIEVESVRSGIHKYKVLKYTNSDGDVSYVAADADAAAKVKGKLGDVDVSDFDTKIKNDNDFFVKYQDGTATWRTSVATMFDKVSDWVFSKLHISRNTYTDVEEKAPADGDYDAAQKAVEEDFDGEFEKATTGDTDIDAVSRKAGEEEDPDAEGGTKPVVDEETGGTSFAGEKTEAEVEAKIKADDGAAVKALDSDDIGGSSSSKVGILSNVAEGTCQAYNITTGMNRMIKAYEKAQIVVIGMKVLEAIQRMQAGDGGGDVIADVVGNMLIKVVSQKYKSQRSSDYFGEDKYVTLEGSVMSSDPIAALFGGSQITSNNKAVKALVVPESSIRRILNTISGNSGTGYKVCSVANLAANFTDVIINIASFGTAELVGILVGMGMGIVKGIVISGLVAFFVPRIAQMLTRNFKEVVEGPIGGAALSWATSAVFSQNAQASGFRPATQETLIKNAQLKQEIEADEIRYARLTKSPFDLSSPYTFMGVLMRTVGASLLQSNSLTKSVNTFTNIATKSLNAFVPSSYAANMKVDDLVSLGECTDLNKMNSGSDAIGDAFCVARNVGDTTKNGTSPEKVVKNLQNMTCSNSDAGKKAFGDDFDDSKEEFDKNLNIEEDSCLGRFISEYTQREAPLGEPDDNIAQKHKISTGSSILDMVGSAITFGVLDLVNSVRDVKYIPNVLGSEYTDPNSSNATYYNYAEQFVVQERMREAATGGEERSSVSVFLDKYYENHPLDNSFEGIMARYSGLSKEQVAFYMELGEELTFLAEYNPDGYYPLAYKAEDKNPKLEFNNDKPTNVFIVNVPYIILETPIGKKDTTA